MAVINDGGPAFPVERQHTEQRDGRWTDRWIPEGGMSLRDYFAGQALIGLLSCEVWVKGLDDAIKRKPGAFKPHVAAHAYLVADEMLAARESK